MSKSFTNNRTFCWLSKDEYNTFFMSLDLLSIVKSADSVAVKHIWHVKHLNLFALTIVRRQSGRHTVPNFLDFNNCLEISEKFKNCICLGKEP